MLVPPLSRFPPSILQLHPHSYALGCVGAGLVQEPAERGGTGALDQPQFTQENTVKRPFILLIIAEVHLNMPLHLSINNFFFIVN